VRTTRHGNTRLTRAARRVSLGAVSTETVWLRSSRFDLALQVGALAAVAPVLILYAALGTRQAGAVVPLAWLVAIPFVHVFGSFFFAFSPQRNRSPSSPRWLAWAWMGWAPLALGLQLACPRVLATFALLYGGWHIFRQNFGFLRELARRSGRGGDLSLRRIDLAATAAPAVALWLFVSARGPWWFLGIEIYHAQVPGWLVALGFVAVVATALVRRAREPSRAGLLLLGGNAVALLAPALALRDLTIVYTLSATFHGFQYLAWLVGLERGQRPDTQGALWPLTMMITWSMIALVAAMIVLGSFLPPAGFAQGVLVVWYVLVPFHYFVDGRIWRRARAPAARAG
jgi:hypothetical protein